jgi:hypothetical protein
MQEKRKNPLWKLFTVVFTFTLTFNPLLPLIPIATASAASNVDQSIEVCFINFDKNNNILQTLPGDTSISLKLYTDAGHLVEGQVNSYGTNFVTFEQTYQAANRNLLGADGIDDAYCVTQQFTNPDNHEYTYTPATITSNLDWLPIRYNDQNNIDFVDLDIAFPYSGEWFDAVAGNEADRNTNSDGHITMTADRLHRRLLVVSEQDQNLPQYAVEFSDSTPTSQEYTLSTVPSILTPGQVINLRFSVQNMGELVWLQGDNPANANPVNVSYHWKNKDTGDYTVYDGNRAILNQTIAYTQNDSNIALQVNAPDIPGNYDLVLDLVHEGVTWFSAKGANTYSVPVNIQYDQPVVVEQPTQPAAAPTMRSLASPQMSLMAAGGSYYTVQPYQGGSWHCGGYDCLSGIAEEYYQCSANGIPNDANWGDMTTKCWWPIYAANQGLFPAISNPWNYIQVGWVLYIPPSPFGGVTPPPPPVNSSNFGGIAGASTFDPYAGMYGSWSAWPKITFDRWVAWDGSYKTDAIKWSETTRPQAPTITGIQTNGDGTAATIYGIAIPKNYPMNVAVWNEFRYCWACGSGWEYHYQQGTAQNVKVVLFKNNWEYIGQVWNDRSDGRWNITLPLGTTLKSGDRVFAEVQIEADYTFSGLKWWSNTYETVNFNLRNPKYTGYPYFGSGGGNGITVPSVYVDTRSIEERWVDQLATVLGSSGGSSLTNVCGFPAKTYSNAYQGNSGAIIFINGRAIYSYGGTWDTFQYYGDRCTRFGAPINNPYVGGNGPFNTPGAYQDFQKGRIYWSWKYVGKFVYGAISTKFEQAGGTNSRYGWPTSEVYQATENGTTLNCQNFEGGRICDGEFTPYSAAQEALKPILGRYPATSEITTFCSGMQKVSIPGGIAYYDPNYKNVRKVTGAIYSAWNENCNTYGLPENDTTAVRGFGGVTGSAQRFNLGSMQFDFYQKGNGAVVILEGEVKNKYDSKGGLGRLGFVQNSYNSPYSAAGRCGSSGLFWNLDNGRIYKHGSSLWIVYGDTTIGQYFFGNGADTKFGLPMNDENTDRLYSWQDFAVTRLQLTWPGGVTLTRDTQYCPGEEPDPLTETELSLKSKVELVGTTFNRASISQTCGYSTHEINEGVAVYDPTKKQSFFIRAELTSYWKANCATLGLPNFDTNVALTSNYSGVVGKFQQFQNGNRVADVYYSSYTNSAIELEGTLRNTYNNNGGFATFGFINPITHSATGVACGVRDGKFWNVENGRIYFNGNSYNSVRANTAIGQYFFGNGADAKFGLPISNEATQIFNAWQNFELTTINWWANTGVSLSKEPTCVTAEQPAPPAPSCPAADTSLNQLCVLPTKTKYTMAESPIMEITFGKTPKLTAEFYTSPAAPVPGYVGNIDRFAYKAIDLSTGDYSSNGKLSYTVPNNLMLWNRMGNGTYITIYYRISGKDLNNNVLSSVEGTLLISNDYSDMASNFEKEISTPKYINPLENCGDYSINGGLDSYPGHNGQDLGHYEGCGVKAVADGVVDQKFTGTVPDCVIASRRNANNMIISVTHTDGTESRYMHMSGVAETLKVGSPVKQGDILGQVDDVGCSDPGFDHLHFEFRLNSWNGTRQNPNDYILF